MVTGLGEQGLPAAAVRYGERDPFAEGSPGRGKRLAVAGVDQLTHPIGGQLDQQDAASAVQASENLPSSRTQGRPIIVAGRTAGSAYMMLGSYADAEDAVQETMLRAWQGWAGSRAGRRCPTGCTALLRPPA